jgi:hypothetical protein
VLPGNNRNIRQLTVGIWTEVDFKQKIMKLLRFSIGVHALAATHYDSLLAAKPNTGHDQVIGAC